jgi:primosomal protein N'
MGLISRSYLAESRAVQQRTERWWTATGEPAGKLGAKADTLLSIVKSAGDTGMSAAEALDLAGTTSTSAKRLIAATLITEVQRPAGQARYQERHERFPTLTEEQADAWAVLEREVNLPTSKPHLVFGVTGSGKTELYLRAIAATLRQDRQAIYLVPEIALTAQLSQRVRDRFPGQVAVLHSGLASGVRQAAWDDIASGARRAVVGARSALFAPVPDLGLIVIDEEHDSSYKQDADTTRGLPPKNWRVDQEPQSSSAAQLRRQRHSGELPSTRSCSPVSRNERPSRRPSFPQFRWSTFASSSRPGIPRS